MLTENLDLFLADFGVPVSSGAITGTGVLDMPDQVVVNGMALTADYQVTVKTSLFGGLLYGAPVIVNGLNYELRECLRVADGAFCVLLLSKIAVALNRILLEDSFAILLEDGFNLQLEA